MTDFNGHHCQKSVLKREPFAKITLSANNMVFIESHIFNEISKVKLIKV